DRAPTLPTTGRRRSVSMRRASSGQLFTVRFDDEEQAVHGGALGIRCLDDRDNRAAGSKHWPGAVEDISADEVEHDVDPFHFVQRVVSKVEILLCPQV